MKNPSQHSTSTSDGSLRRLVVGLTLFGALMFGARSAQAQTFTVLHAFTGGLDGSSPYAGLSMDQRGNLYGTASAGGKGYGTVFELSHKGSGRREEVKADEQKKNSPMVMAKLATPLSR